MSAKKKRKRPSPRPERLVDRVSLAAAERDTNNWIDFRQLAELVLDLLAFVAADHGKGVPGFDEGTLAPQCVDVLHALCLTVLGTDAPALRRMHDIAASVIRQWEETVDGPVPLPSDPKLRKARLDELMIRMVDAIVEHVKGDDQRQALKWAHMVSHAVRGYRSEALSPPKQTAKVLRALRGTGTTNLGKRAAIALSALLGEKVLFPTRQKVALSRQRAKERDTELQRRAHEAEPQLCAELKALGSDATAEHAARHCAAEDAARHSAAFFCRRVLTGLYDRGGTGDESERVALDALQGVDSTPSARSHAVMTALVQWVRSRSSPKVVTPPKL
jgi:hypothetical protein